MLKLCFSWVSTILKEKQVYFNKEIRPFYAIIQHRQMFVAFT